MWRLRFERSAGALDPREIDPVKAEDAEPFLRRLPAIPRILTQDGPTSLPTIRLPAYTRTSLDDEIDGLELDFARQNAGAADRTVKRDDDVTRIEKETTLKALRKKRDCKMNSERFSVAVNEATRVEYIDDVQKAVTALFLDHQTRNGADALAAARAELEEAVSLVMQVFSAENVTGELCDTELTHFKPLFDRFCFAVNAEDAFAIRLLTCDGESPSPCVTAAPLLLLASAVVTAEILEEGKTEATPVFPLNNIWRLRTLFKHQLCLEHRSHTLFKRLAQCVDALTADSVQSKDPLVLIEIGHVQNYYHKRELAADSFSKAMNISMLKLSETSFMGVRTKFQQHQIAQSALMAESSSALGDASPIKHLTHAVLSAGQQDVTFPLPNVVASEDEPSHELYDFPRTAPGAPILDAYGNPLTPLTLTDKALLLALCINLKSASAASPLVRHRMQNYLERLIADNGDKVYIQQSYLLLQRARLERDRSRLAQRSFLQVQELIDQHSSRRDPLLPTFHRADPRVFYTVGFPMIWELRKEFAELCFEDNLFKTALDLFEQTRDWKSIIECCKKLDKRRRAEMLARELLESDPQNPSLYVALGEATRDEKHLIKAWELCEGKMAAPMRAMARLMLDREKYQEVVDCFDKAVAINPIFGGDWFSLGFASMKLKDLSRGAVAFTRVCQMDPNDAFAWNNLGSMLLQQGKMRPAFNAISQALRNNRRSWRMWQNYFAIGAELKEVAEATQALFIMLDIGARDVVLDTKSLNQFTDVALAYIRHEIRSTDNAHPSDEVSASKDGGVINVNAGKSLLDEVLGDEALVSHASLAEDENAEEEAEEIAEGFAPLGADVEMPESFFPEKEEKRLEAQAKQNDVAVARFRIRLVEVFEKAMSLFVNNADLYDCAARVYREVDGPQKAFQYREKEHRVASQVDQWARDKDKFDRLVQALTSQAKDAIAFLEMASSSAEEEESSTSTSAASRLKLMKDAFDAVKKTEGHVDAALLTSGDYMEAEDGYRKLQVLRKQLNLAIRDANQKK